MGNFRAGGGSLPTRAASLARLAVGAAALSVLGFAYALEAAAGRPSPVDYLGYFTNLTATLTALVLIAQGALGIAGHPSPAWLVLARGAAVSASIVVAVIYYAVVPGTGSAPVWVSIALHAALPVYAMLDWALVRERPPLPWRHLWIALPYPLLWLTGTLLRGVTDGWVPYGFLLPERGAAAILATVLGLLAALLLAAIIAWVLSRIPGARWATTAAPTHRL